MNAEGDKLRDAKNKLETALSEGRDLKDARTELEGANEAYRVASAHVRKHAVVPKATAKAKASGVQATA